MQRNGYNLKYNHVYLKTTELENSNIKNVDVRT